jgi:hypothetical protein
MITAVNRSGKVKRESGAPGGIRTHDQLIKSQLLYQLSYRGKIYFSNRRLFS